MTGRSRVLRAVVQWVFLVAVAVAITLAWIDQGDAVVAALARTDALWLLLALVGAVAVLLSLVPHWRALAAALGSPVGFADARALVVAGQLGKYIPGGVWTIGAQGYVAHRAQLSWRFAVAVGLLQLGTLIGAALVVGGVLIAAGTTGLHPLLGVGAAGLGAVGLLPPVYRMIARLLLRPEPAPGSGPNLPVTLTSLQFWVASSVVALGCALALEPGAALAVIAATAIGYAAGAVVVIAPAGIGVREVVIIGMLSPVMPTADAAAIALLLRLATVLGDLIGAALLAGLGWRRAD